MIDSLTEILFNLQIWLLLRLCNGLVGRMLIGDADD